jgi:hypothetical protein
LLRAKDEQNFQNQIQEIIKEFEQFQAYYKKLESENEELKTDIIEFLTTLNAALLKVGGLDFWTLSAQPSDSKIAVLCQIIQQKVGELDPSRPKLAQSKSAQVLSNEFFTIEEKPANLKLTSI